MVDSYTNTSVAVASSSAIPFNTNRYLTGCGTCHTAGSPTITIKKPGYYLVNFNGDLSAASTGLLQTQLQVNGDLVPGARSSTTLATAGNIEALSFSTIVRVLNSCNCIDNTANISVINTGLASTFTNAEINVIRLN